MAAMASASSSISSWRVTRSVSSRPTGSIASASATEAEPRAPLGELALGGEVVDPVVVAVVAEEGGEERARLEAGLPVPVGDVAEPEDDGHGPHGGHDGRPLGGSDAAPATADDVQHHDGENDGDDDDEECVKHGARYPPIRSPNPARDGSVVAGPRRRRAGDATG